MKETLAPVVLFCAMLLWVWHTDTFQSVAFPYDYWSRRQTRLEIFIVQTERDIEAAKLAGDTDMVETFQMIQDFNRRDLDEARRQLMQLEKW